MFRMVEQRESARQQRRAAHRAEFEARELCYEGLRAYVEEHERERLATYDHVHLFPDRIIRLPHPAAMRPSTGAVVEHAVFPVAGVTATVGSGRIDGSSRLLGAPVPGGPGRPRTVDARESWLVISGPRFQWAVKVEPAMVASAHWFAARVMCAGAAAAAPGGPGAPKRRLTLVSSR